MVAFAVKLARWRASRAGKSFDLLTRRSESASRDELEVGRNAARRLERSLIGFLVRAETKLSEPAYGSAATIGMARFADWAWRPRLWRGRIAQSTVSCPQSGLELAPELKLHHDDPGAQILVRQVKAAAGTRSPAPFSLAVEVFAFQGSFLSLSLACPADMLDGLTGDHIIHVAGHLRCEHADHLRARLNLQDGPNVQQQFQDIDIEGNRFELSFDLGASRVNGQNLESAWIDLFLGEAPAHNAIHIGDLLVSRTRRASF